MAEGEETKTKSEMNGNESNLIKNETVDPSDVVNCEINPWSVEDVSVFLKYNCPECEFADLDLKIFVDHALENHTRSNVLFSTRKSNDYFNQTNGQPDVQDDNVQEIKQEIYDEYEDYMDTENQYYEDDVKDEYFEEAPKPKKRKKRVKKENVKQKVKKEKKIVVPDLKCVVCFTEFESDDLLKSHYNEIHKKGKFEVCTLCDYKYELHVKHGNKWARLQYHIDQSHPDLFEKTHFCQYCTKSFIYRYTLKAHEQNHNARMKQVCDICGYECFQKKGKYFSDVPTFSCMIILL